MLREERLVLGTKVLASSIRVLDNVLASKAVLSSGKPPRSKRSSLSQKSNFNTINQELNLPHCPVASVILSLTTASPSNVELSQEHWVSQF